MFDLSSITPLARPIVEAAAIIYYRHTQSWFVGLVAHGSAVKGGFIAGCSDIDLQLYLLDSAFTNNGQLPLALCMAIQRDLVQIDPTPFQYIQCYPYGTTLPENYLGPIPGAYTIVAGTLPIAEATAQALQDSAHRALADLNPAPIYITHGLLEHGGGRLQLNMRWLCTDVWPTLYHVVSLQQDNPLVVWALPKEQIMSLLSPEKALSSTIYDFYQALLAYYPAAHSVEDALTVIEHGLAFLHEAKSWYRDKIWV